MIAAIRKRPMTAVLLAALLLTLAATAAADLHRAATCIPAHVDLLRGPDETDEEYWARWNELAYGHCRGLIFNRR